MESKKYAIRKLKRQQDGTMIPTWVDAQTGEIVTDLSGYDIADLQDNNSKLSDGTTSTTTDIDDKTSPSGDTTPSGTGQEASAEQKFITSEGETSNTRSSIGSVFDNDVVFNQPEVPIKDAIATGGKVGSVQRSELPATQGQPQPQGTQTQSNNIQTSGKFGNVSGVVSSTNKGGLSPEALNIASTLNDKGFGNLGVNSTSRDKNHNAGVGGVKGSQHLSGNAIDLATRGLSPTQLEQVLDAALVGGAKGIGAYPSGALHVDARQNPMNWGPNGTSKHEIDQMPAWSQADLQALKDAEGHQYLSSQGPMPTARPDPNADLMPSIYQQAATDKSPSMGERMSAVSDTRGVGTQSRTPGELAAMGYTSRSPEEKQSIAQALAGELSAKSLQGLANKDPVAMAEFANMLGAIENRAATGKSISSILAPNIVNSTMSKNMGTTTNNYATFKGAIDTTLNDFYSGRMASSLTAPAATHWANMDKVTPDWSKNATASKVGDHTFFSDVMLADNSRVQFDLPEFQAYESRPNAQARSEINSTVGNSWAGKAGEGMAFNTPEFGENRDISSQVQDYANSRENTLATNEINDTFSNSWANDISEVSAFDTPNTSGEGWGSSDYNTESKDSYGTSETYGDYGGFDGSSGYGSGLGSHSASRDSINDTASSSWSSDAGKGLASSAPDFGPSTTSGLGSPSKDDSDYNSGWGDYGSWL